MQAAIIARSCAERMHAIFNKRRAGMPVASQANDSMCLSMLTRTRGTVLRMRPLAFVAVIAVPWSASAAEQSEPSVAQTPASVNFRVVVEAPRAYRQMLEKGLDIVRWQGEQRVTMPLLERLTNEARVAAANALAAEGYFSADVKSAIEPSRDAEVLVRLTVTPGPRTYIRGLDLRFSGEALKDPEGMKRIESVRQAWRLRPGEPFQQADWDAAKQEALARLRRGRYAAAQIAASEARIDPAQRTADLTVDLDSGPSFFAGGVIVTGLKRYPESIVQNLNPIARGEAYEATQLDLFQRRLLETGYFNAVQFTIDPDAAQAAAAPLRVNVIESSSQRIDTGLAFSTDTGFGVTFDYSNVDVFDQAWRFRPRLNVNEKQQQINVTLDSPPRPGGTWNTYLARLQQTDIQNQVSRELVVGYGHNWGLESTPSQLTLSGHFEDLTIGGSTENNYATFVGYRKTFRTTDDIVSPRRGVLGTIELGASVPGASSREFVRGRVKVNWLIPLGLNGDFLLRGEAGAVGASSRDRVVSSFLFRTGGDQTIRGYAFQAIGVKQADAVVGGRYLALASAEYTHWITQTIGAAVFVDAGDAFDRLASFRTAVGAGIGARWRSPIGPLRADVAYGFRTDQFRLHFSVGYSF
jgi:translocation and assembly module TamA